MARIAAVPLLQGGGDAGQVKSGGQVLVTCHRAQFIQQGGAHLSEAQRPVGEYNELAGIRIICA